MSDYCVCGGDVHVTAATNTGWTVQCGHCSHIMHYTDTDLADIGAADAFDRIAAAVVVVLGGLVGGAGAYMAWHTSGWVRVGVAAFTVAYVAAAWQLSSPIQHVWRTSR